MKKAALVVVLALVVAGSVFLANAATAFADQPSDPNISDIVVPAAQTGTFGQTVCSELGKAGIEDDTVLSAQGHSH